MIFKIAIKVFQKCVDNFQGNFKEDNYEDNLQYR